MKLIKYLTTFLTLAVFSFVLFNTDTDIVEASSNKPKYELGYGLNWTFETNKKETISKGYNKAGEQKAIYIRGAGSLNGIKIGDSKNSVLKKYPNPTKTVKYKSSLLGQKYVNKYGNETHGIFLVDETVFTVFYDNHDGDKVVALLSVNAETLAQTEFFYEKSEKFEKDFNTITIMVQNQTRIQHGLKPLQDMTSKWGHIAKAHSDNMIKNNFFGHVDSDGSRGGDRMKRNKMKFEFWGENLAHGYETAFHSHEALMNSLGHRKIILLPNATKSFAGTSFDKNHLPYLTVNYYK